MRRKTLQDLMMLGCVGATSLGASNVFAQESTPAQSEEVDTVVVTGFRASLQSSTDAKRQSVGFTDAIFAEDMGKFPDTNLAESFNRIPGITITRETSGEGLNIAIRGLGTNFTRVLLNDAPVAIASTGRTDSQGRWEGIDWGQRMPNGPTVSKWGPGGWFELPISFYRSLC